MATVFDLTENTAPDGTDRLYITDGTNDEGVQIANLLKGSGAEVPASKITGTVAHEQGGLEADLSAYDGLIRIAGGSTSNLKFNFSASAAPTAGDDSGDGYVVGSRWIDTTNDAEYICVDNTAAAAVWVQAAGVNLAITGTMVVASDLTLAAGSITSASGAISFGNENLSTTGTLSGGPLTVTDGLYSASIDSSGLGTGANFYSNTTTHIGSSGASSVFFYTSGVNRYQITYDGNHNFQSGNITTTGTIASTAASLAVVAGLSSGVTPTSIADDLHVRSNGSAGMTVSSPDANNATYAFGSVSDNDYAWLQGFYNAGAPFVRGSIATTEVWRWDSTGITSAGYLQGTTANGYLDLRGDSGATNYVRIADTGVVTVSGGDLTLSAGDLTVSAGDVTFAQGSDTNVRFRLSSGINQIVSMNDAFSGYTELRVDAANYIFGSQAGGSLVLGATATSNNAQFYATKTYSAASGTIHAARIQAQQNVAKTGEFAAARIFSTAAHTSGTVDEMFGVWGSTVHTGAGGTTTDAYGGFFDVRNTTASHTVTNAYGVYVGAFTATGTITNRWGIYQEGASENNYLAGDLRIGTTSAGPNSENLVVDSGSSGIAGYFDSGITQRTLVLHTDDTTNGKQLVLHDAGSSGYATSMIGSKSDALLFYTGSGGIERFRVASNAYAIGIGTTDIEAWSASYTAIELGDGGAIMAGRAVSRGEMYLMGNAYYDGSYKYKNTNEASQFTIYDGYFAWDTAASGTADAAITWTERMRLTNTGELQIGSYIQGTTTNGYLDLRGDSGATVGTRLTDAGMLLVGDTTNANMTVGLTINQGANDDQILALKSSDVAHGMTSIAETDTFFYAQKLNGANGGVTARAFSESTSALRLVGSGTTADTNKTTTAAGFVEILGEIKSSTTVSNIGADDNLVVFRSASTGSNAFIIAGDGDFFYDGADGGAFDVYEDAHLVRAFALATSKDTLRTAHDEWVQYNEQTLVDIGVLGAPVKDGGLINGAQLQRLHTGAIWQNYTAIADTRDEVAILKTELAETKSRLAIAESRLKQLPQA